MGYCQEFSLTVDLTVPCDILYIPCYRRSQYLNTPPFPVQTSKEQNGRYGKEPIPQALIYMRCEMHLMINDNTAPTASSPPPLGCRIYAWNTNVAKVSLAPVIFDIKDSFQIFHVRYLKQVSMIFSYKRFYKHLTQTHQWLYPIYTA